MKVKNILLLLSLMLVSGVLSGTVFDISGQFKFANFWGYLAIPLFFTLPGICFGLGLGFYFQKIEKTQGRKLLQWILSSTVAYLIAFIIGWSAALLKSIGYIAGGLVGSTILALAVRKLFPYIKNIYPMIFSGGVGAVLFGFLFHMGNALDIPAFGLNGLPKDINIFLAFALWQTIMGFTIAISIDYSKKTRSYENTPQTPALSTSDKSTLYFILIVVIIISSLWLYISNHIL